MSEKARKVERVALIALVVIGLVAIGLTYYFLVYNVVEVELRAIRTERAATEQAIENMQSQLISMNRMQSEMDRLEGDTRIRADRMPSYNAGKEELSLLNRLLSSAEDYSISFRNVTRDGDQIRRRFALEFTTQDFDMAREIVHHLLENDLRCLIEDISCVSVYDREQERELIRVSMDATFYETMVDGMPDAGLPADTAS